MRSFFGVPAHPLLVHVPAVLLPLAALGVVVMLIRPAWHARYRWAVLAIGFVGAVGAILAASAGESFEHQIEATEGRGAAAGWQDHAAAGETARLFAMLFFIVLAAFVLVPWFLERRAKDASIATVPKWVSVALTVLVLAGSAATVTTVVLAGHSGAKAAWCDVATPPNCEDGG
jgi:hypothetical protein